jgi:co-chaperonin GroES (HSP10)
MKIKPLTGQVLVEVLPAETDSAGGIALPNRSKSAEEVEQSHIDPQKPGPITGIVRAIGPWPVLKNGMAMPPEFGVGAKVLLSPWRGTALQRHLGERLRLVPNQDVLAVLT